MAKRATKPRSPRSGSGRTVSKPDFHRQTVLFQWALGKLGVKNLEEFRERFQLSPSSADGINPNTGNHHFFDAIANALPTAAGVIARDRLARYEQNILEHTQAMNSARLHHGQPQVAWKYHQYLALLLTEIFLEHFFDDPENLRTELNEQIASHNEAMEQYHRQAGAKSATEWKVDAVNPIDADGDSRAQLARLAFWGATGSGKTLLLHTNVRQFKQYHSEAHTAGKWPKLDQVLLITPNDGLSEQHEMEFRYSGLEAVAAGDSGADGLFAEQYKRAIKIISIHKLADESGQKTMATEAFEGCNLVLVDEGHRGAGRGEEGKWLTRRDQLAKGGFAIEYSATFKEAIGNDEPMRNRYARSILFDYAYRSFYRDGYGKDFTILNLEQDDKQKRYLTAAMLLYYQQLRVWTDGGVAMKPFLIDKPLWVFVGHTVVGKVKNEDDKESVSDVVEVLRFLHGFLNDSNGTTDLIHSLLMEGFKDHNGRDLLANRLPHIDVSGDKPALAKTIYANILRDVFNAPGGGSLAVQLLKGATGELALKVGEGDPFGVVNVGDPAAVADACTALGVVRLEDDQARPSLFNSINRDDSPINLLVGSRKFTEGWNSWRVSSIGLMRMGKNEGTQIIQLFGRGVRLRGYRMSLRRSSVLNLPGDIPRPKNLRQVETLQVFGVKANYMNTFREWIFSEVPEAMGKEIWELPVVKTLPPQRKLKTIRLKDEIDGETVERGQAFRRLGPLVKLRPPHPTEHADAWLRSHKTKLNWLPRIRGLVGADRTISVSVGEVVDAPHQQFTSTHIMLMDIDDLLFGLEAFKAARGLDRLHADRAAIVSLLNAIGWYELKSNADDMRLDNYQNRTQWQRMAQQLINSYAEKFYRFIRGRWEAPYIEVADVDEAYVDGNDYTIETTELVQTAAEIEQINTFVSDLKKALERNVLSPWSQFGARWRTVPFAGHLYQPLLFVGKNMQIKISPVPLDRHEAQFVDDLAKWCGQNPGCEVYLLRNQAVTGLGFFQAANFFPDFLMWVQDGDVQHLAFIDPKGLMMVDPSDPKIQFATRDVPRLQEIIDRQKSALTLHGFILSNTLHADLIWSAGGEELMSKPDVEALNVLFQADDPATYIATMMDRVRNAPTLN